MSKPDDATSGDLARTTIEVEEVFRLTLCGSTMFRAEYELWNKRLTLAGFLVYSVSGFGHSGDTFSDEEKARLDQVHLAKIDASHAIVVLNVGGYVGESTAREIAYAKTTGKPVYFLEGDNIIYRLRTGPDGATSLRYRAFDWETLGPVAQNDALRIAATALLDACIVDFGDPVEFDGDDGAVMSGKDGDGAITFKHMRDLTAALGGVPRSDPSQDGDGARYGVPSTPGQSAVTPCKAWFNSQVDACAWAEATGGEVWDLVTGKRVA